MVRSLGPSIGRISTCLLLGLLTPALLSAGPITYEVQWSLDFADEGPYWITYSDEPLGAPSTTTFTFNSNDNLFGGFVVNWWGIEFDYGTLLNEFLSPDDRASIAAALLTPDNNSWEGITHSHDSPTFSLGLDAPALSPFAFSYPDGQPSLFGSSETMNYHLHLEFASPECGELPAGCAAGGGYRVARVPEPATFMLISMGGSIILLARRVGDKRKRSSRLG